MESYSFSRLKESNLSNWFEFLCRVFTETSRQYFETHWYNDPDRSINSVFVAYWNGDIVASVRIHWRSMYIERQMERVAGIGEVATSPEHRGKGLASTLLLEALNASKESGTSFSVLHTGSAAPLYAKLGYKSTAIFWRTSVLGHSDLIRLEPMFRITNREINHDSQIAEIYNSFSSQFNGCVVRSKEYWSAWVLAVVDNTMVAFDPDSERICAYMSWRVKRGCVHICEFGCFSVCDPGVFDHLFVACANDAFNRLSLDTLRFRCPERLIPENSTTGDLLVSRECDEGWMIQSCVRNLQIPTDFFIMDTDAF